LTPLQARRSTRWLCALALLTGGCAPSPDAPRGALTSIGQIRALTPSDAEGGRAVRIRGTVTYAHLGSRSLIVQAGDEGVFVDTGGSPIDLRPGREVEVEGSTGLGDTSVIVLASKVADLAAAPMPRAARVSIQELSSGAYSNRLVEAEGVVRSSVRENDGRMTLNLANEDGAFQARLNLGSSTGFGDGLIDARVMVRGVARTAFTMRGRPIRLQVLAADLKEVIVVKAAPPDGFAVPVQRIGPLLEARRRAAPHRVHVQGVKRQLADGTLVLTDGTGSIPVHLADASRVSTGEVLDVLAFITAAAGEVRLEDAVFRRIRDRAAAPAVSTGVPPTKSAQLPILETIGEVHRLPPVEAQ
jgi:hypothetical protein